MRHLPVTAIEIVEDFSSTASCTEGFLQLRRLRAQNQRADGTRSPVYRIDVVDRPKLDAVAVLIWRRGARGLEFLTRTQLRPAAYFRVGKRPVIPDDRQWLFCEEIVAGLLEPSDEGHEALLARAAEEVFEEAGFRVAPSAISPLGPPFFVAPGILSEKIFLTHVEVTGLTAVEPGGDGSPMEEGSELRWRSQPELTDAIARGELQDAKTELALRRFVDPISAAPAGATARSRAP